MSSVVYEWVIGKFDGSQAKHVSSLAEVGVGYQILERLEGGWVVAAFKRPVMPLPDHLERVTEQRLIDRLERY